MITALRFVYVTVNVSETEEVQLVLKNVVELDTVFDALKCLYPDMLSVILTVSL